MYCNSGSHANCCYKVIEKTEKNIARAISGRRAWLNADRCCPERGQPDLGRYRMLERRMRSPAPAAHRREGRGCLGTAAMHRHSEFMTHDVAALDLCVVPQPHAEEEVTGVEDEGPRRRGTLFDATSHDAAPGSTPSNAAPLCRSVPPKVTSPDAAALASAQPAVGRAPRSASPAGCRCHGSLDGGGEAGEEAGRLFVRSDTSGKRMEGLVTGRGHAGDDEGSTVRRRAARLGLEREGGGGRCRVEVGGRVRVSHPLPPFYSASH